MAKRKKKIVKKLKGKSKSRKRVYKGRKPSGKAKSSKVQKLMKLAKKRKLKKRK